MAIWSKLFTVDLTANENIMNENKSNKMKATEKEVSGEPASIPVAHLSMSTRLYPRQFSEGTELLQHLLQCLPHLQSQEIRQTTSIQEEMPNKHNSNNKKIPHTSSSVAVTGVI